MFACFDAGLQVYSDVITVIIFTVYTVVRVQVSLLVRRYPFTLLGGERHCESKLSCPRTQHNDPADAQLLFTKEQHFQSSDLIELIRDKEDRAEVN